MAVTEKRRLGDIGENIACVFLEKHGFEIIERNYLRKWGEIDIVAKKNNILHFVEVKSVSRPNVPFGTGGHHKETYRAEENLHPQKLKRLARAMQTYVLEKRLDLEWQLDLITVRIDEKNRNGRAEMLENIII
jgi:putative endonuclease